jgi:hypothetical protein
MICKYTLKFILEGGWLAGADFTYEQCTAGKENLCQSSQPTCLGHEGKA